MNFINKKISFNHTIIIGNFSICVMWKKNNVLINKISVPSTITFQKPHLFKPSMIELFKIENSATN